VQAGARAIVGADLLVLLVDGREGLIPGDERIARELRETGIPILLAINKTDDKRSQKSSMEFFQLGFDPVSEISAEHGIGVAEVDDEMVKRLEEKKGLGHTEKLRAEGQGLEARRSPRALRPLLSAFDSPTRKPASPSSAGPTSQVVVGEPAAPRGAGAGQRHAGHDARRDRLAVDLAPRHFRIIDTAGMRRPGRISRGGKVEMVSVALAKASIADADVVALVTTPIPGRRIRMRRLAARPIAPGVAS